MGRLPELRRGGVEGSRKDHNRAAKRTRNKTTLALAILSCTVMGFLVWINVTFLSAAQENDASRHSSSIAAIQMHRIGVAQLTPPSSRTMRKKEAFVIRKEEATLSSPSVRQVPRYGQQNSDNPQEKKGQKVDIIPPRLFALDEHISHLLSISLASPSSSSSGALKVSFYIDPEDGVATRRRSDDSRIRMESYDDADHHYSDVQLQEDLYDPPEYEEGGPELRRDMAENCRPVLPWHVTPTPTCNIVHEIDLSYRGHMEERNNENDNDVVMSTNENKAKKLKYAFHNVIKVLGHGQYRAAWHVERQLATRVEPTSAIPTSPQNDKHSSAEALGHEHFILKTWKQWSRDKNSNSVTDLYYLFSLFTYRYHMVDALLTDAMNKQRQSNHAVDIYGFCGHAVLNQMGHASLTDFLEQHTSTVNEVDVHVALSTNNGEHQKHMTEEKAALEAQNTLTTSKTVTIVNLSAREKFQYAAQVSRALADFHSLDSYYNNTHGDTDKKRSVLPAVVDANVAPLRNITFPTVMYLDFKAENFMMFPSLSESLSSTSIYNSHVTPPDENKHNNSNDPPFVIKMSDFNSAEILQRNISKRISVSALDDNNKKKGDEFVEDESSIPRLCRVHRRPDMYSPEQARSGSDPAGNATPQSDVFALGGILYHIVFGRTLQQELQGQLDSDPAPIPKQYEKRPRQRLLDHIASGAGIPSRETMTRELALQRHLRALVKPVAHRIDEQGNDIKNNTKNVEEDVENLLLDIIVACWIFDPKLRPTAQEVSDFFTSKSPEAK
jgi:hypothetical protein